MQDYFAGFSIIDAWRMNVLPDYNPWTLVDQYKPIQHQPFAIEIFQDLIVTTRSCPWDKKSLLKKIYNKAGQSAHPNLLIYLEKTVNDILIPSAGKGWE